MPENPNLNHLNVPKVHSNNARASQLPTPLRHEFEAGLGTNLSEVRIHQNHAATLMQAEAFSRGSDIYFSPGAYQPHTPEGKELIAHELTHVVQQNPEKTDK
jgi:hypothetical protein